MDARRKILQGRRTITRTYYSKHQLNLWYSNVCAYVCLWLWQGVGGKSISTYSWPITNYYPPYSMKELDCINSVHTLFSECAKWMHNVGYICMSYLCNNSHYSLHYLDNAFCNRMISRGFWPPCLPDLKHVIFFVRHTKGCVHYNNHQWFKIIWSKAFGMSCLQFQQNLIMQCAYLLNMDPCLQAKGRSCVGLYIVYIYNSKGKYFQHEYGA